MGRRPESVLISSTKDFSVAVWGNPFLNGVLRITAQRGSLSFAQS
jgi:hypothetical protein